MFPNLRAEMKRKNITVRCIANFLGRSESWLNNRLSGRTNLLLEDGVRINKQFFTEIDIEVLFSDSVIIPTYKKVV